MATPVTKPVAELIVAAPALLLDQTPPVVVSDITISVPRHNVGKPSIVPALLGVLMVTIMVENEVPTL